MGKPTFIKPVFYESQWKYDYCFHCGYPFDLYGPCEQVKPEYLPYCSEKCMVESFEQENNKGKTIDRNN